MKRVFDLVTSSLGLLILSPLLAVVALVIKITSPGPVFFRQKRVGQFGREFSLVKFRSMTHRRACTGPLVTAGGDRRVTPVGRWLRRTKIDELPQLWNVVRGDMSLVGPRPEVPRYVDTYPEAFAPLLRYRPGITSACSLALIDEERLLRQSADPERFYIDEILPRKIAAYRQELSRRSFPSDLRTILATVLPVRHLRPQVELYLHGLVRMAPPRAARVAAAPRLVAATAAEELAAKKIPASA